MEKIARWWAVFLTELDAGKKVSLFYTVVLVALATISITLYRTSIKKDDIFAKKEATYVQKISDITDSCNARERRDKLEATNIRIQMLLDQINEGKKATDNAKTIIKNNKKILSNK